MTSELNGFANVADYLKDPLVLSGFVVFVGFLGLRQILRAGIIPNLGRGYGYRILRLTISYGFIIGIAIVLLGMGLRYRELSEDEQRRAAAIVSDELRANATVIGELAKNADTLFNLSSGIATILRDQRFKVLSGLFPATNIDPMVDEAILTNLYNERIDWLTQTGQWQNLTERRRTEEACAAVVRFIGRTRSTAESLADLRTVRYPITRQAYDANLSVIRKVQVVDMTNLAEVYYQMSDARVFYDRIVNSTLEYLRAVESFCSSLPPDRAALGASLAVERLTFRLVPEYKRKLLDVTMVILTNLERLESVAVRA